MKLKIAAIWLVVCSVLLISCKIQTESTTTYPTPNLDSAYASQNKFDWTGDYEGLLPCANCIGIKTEITLNANQTYTLKETYLDHSSKVYNSKGYFYFDTTQPDIITFDKAANERKFFVGDNYIESRNLDGSEITSILKVHYKIKKLDHK